METRTNKHKDYRESLKRLNIDQGFEEVDESHRITKPEINSVDFNNIVIRKANEIREFAESIYGNDYDSLTITITPTSVSFNKRDELVVANLDIPKFVDVNGEKY